MVSKRAKKNQTTKAIANKKDMNPGKPTVSGNIKGNNRVQEKPTLKVSGPGSQQTAIQGEATGGSSKKNLSKRRPPRTAAVTLT